MPISDFTKKALGYSKPKVSPFTQRIVDSYNWNSSSVQNRVPKTFQQGFMKNGKFATKDVTVGGGKIEKAPRKTGFFEGVKRFGARTGTAFLDLVSEAGDFFTNTVARHLGDKPLIGVGPISFEPKKLKEARKAWKGFFDKQVEEGKVPTRQFKEFVDKIQQKEYLQPTEEWQKAPLQEKLTTRLGETVLQLGPGVISSIGAFAINPAFGFSVIVGSTANNVTEDAIAYGVPRDSAELLGASTGILVGALERIVPSRIFSTKGIKNQFIGGFTRRLANSVLLEAGTEITQENVQLIAEKTFRDDLGWDEVATRNAMAGLGGVMGGAGMQTIASFANDVQRKEILQMVRETPAGLSLKDVGKADPLAQEARNKVEKVLKLMGNDVKDINIIGSTAEGKVNPKDLDILITPKKSLGQLTSDKLYNRMDLQKVFEDELKLLFPDKKIHITIGEYKASHGAKISLNEYSQAVKGVKTTVKKAKPLTGKEQLEIREQAKTEKEQATLKKQTLEFFQENLESQYQQFKKSKLKGLATAEDDAQLKKLNKDVSSEVVDNMLYSEELKGDEVLDMFQSRLAQERQPLPKIPKETKAVVAEKARQKTKAIAKETMDKVKNIYDKRVAKIKDSKEILQRRRAFIRAVQQQFGLSDADLKSITKRDIRLMTNIEFKTFLDDIRTKSEQLAKWYQAKNELVAQIQEKELNIEPLRQAMEFPSINKMSIAQLQEFNEAIEPFMKGDVFLSKRKLETINRTELDGIKTYREARERLAKKLNIPVEELTNIEVSEFDRFRGESGLAEKNPFYKMMIEETAKLRFVREAEYLDIEQETNKRAKKVKTGLLQKFIPQQKNIVKWFEAKDKNTVTLTSEETSLVKFMQEEWSKALDYLVKVKALSKGRDSNNYFTHIRRGILEAIKEDGIIKPFKEVFNQYKLDEQKFDILDTRTGEVMALDKFFKFAVRRSGELKPTDNVVRAFLTYMKTFKKKQALDELVPLIDIYAHSLTPKGTTEEGLLLHGNLVKFTKEWLNTKKGRRVTLTAKQGGKIDWALRAGKAVTSLMDLGLNIPVAVATQLGELAISYELVGKIGLAKGYYKLLATKKGRRIVRKYRNFTNKSPWKELIEPMKNVGDRLNAGLFSLFADANTRRNEVFLLANLTKEEWQNETLSPERLAELKVAVGRYGVIEDAKSIIGATPEAGTLTQYKSWAIPIVSSQAKNFVYMAKYLKTIGKENKAEAKRATLETYRMLELGLLVVIVGSMFIDEDDDTFLGQLKRRAYQEALTLYGASASIASVPRLLTFLNDLSKAFVSIIKLETYKESKFGKYEAGDLKGANQLKRIITPRALKQFESDPEKTLEDVRKEILEDIESGELSVEAAKSKLLTEIKKVQKKEKEKIFGLSFEDYRKNLASRVESNNILVGDAKKELVEYLEENVDSFKSPDESSFVDKVILVAKAIKTDPVTAFVFLFQGEKIRKIENKAIIVERMSLEESQAVKKERSASQGFILDHTVPLQLGGSNSKKNLKLVTEEEWESYTIVENYLGNRLRKGLIDKKEAQKLILEFKEGKLTKEDIIGLKGR